MLRVDAVARRKEKRRWIRVVLLKEIVAPVVEIVILVVNGLHLLHTCDEFFLLH